MLFLIPTRLSGAAAEGFLIVGGEAGLFKAEGDASVLLSRGSDDPGNTHAPVFAPVIFRALASVAQG